MNYLFQNWCFDKDPFIEEIINIFGENVFCTITLEAISVLQRLIRISFLSDWGHGSDRRMSMTNESKPNGYRGRKSHGGNHIELSHS